MSAQEAERIGAFIETHLESQDRFTFQDPWDGIEYEDCVAPGEGYRTVAEGEHGFRLEIRIEQRQV